MKSNGITRGLILVTISSIAIGAELSPPEYSEPLDERYAKPETFRTLFDELQAAVSADDYSKFAELFHYPVRVFVPAEGHAIRLVNTIETPSELVGKIESLFSDDSLAVLKTIDYEKTSTLWYGVHIPGGGVILGDYCIASGECEPTDTPSVEVLYLGPPQLGNEQ
jgi:hypothetical protein